jgi:hypothetical protein
MDSKRPSIDHIEKDEKEHSLDVIEPRVPATQDWDEDEEKKLVYAL